MDSAILMPQGGGRYNANTGELLCGMNAEFGKSTEVYDEFGYAVLPPCLWGSAADGLQEPSDGLRFHRSGSRDAAFNLDFLQSL